MTERAPHAAIGKHELNNSIAAFEFHRKENQKENKSINCKLIHSFKPKRAMVSTKITINPSISARNFICAKIFNHLEG